MQRRIPTVRGLAVLAAGAAVVALAGVGTASAAPEAGPVQLGPLQYSCAFPSGTHTVSVRISAVLNDVRAGVPSNGIEDFAAQVTVPEAAYSSLRLAGARSVEGSASASGVVTDAAGVRQTVTAPRLVVPRTSLPSSGPLVVTGSGDFPQVTIVNPGTATVNITDSFTTTLTPKNASGGTTFPGTFTSRCTLAAGQPTLLGTAQVTS